MLSRLGWTLALDLLSSSVVWQRTTLLAYCPELKTMIKALQAEHLPVVLWKGHYKSCPEPIPAYTMQVHTGRCALRCKDRQAALALGMMQLMCPTQQDVHCNVAARQLVLICLCTGAVYAKPLACLASCLVLMHCTKWYQMSAGHARFLTNSKTTSTRMHNFGRSCKPVKALQ